jgi:hypothetical protein
MAARPSSLVKFFPSCALVGKLIIFFIVLVIVCSGCFFVIPHPLITM